MNGATAARRPRAPAGAGLVVLATAVTIRALFVPGAALDDAESRVSGRFARVGLGEEWRDLLVPRDRVLVILAPPHVQTQPVVLVGADAPPGGDQPFRELREPKVLQDRPVADRHQRLGHDRAIRRQTDR